MDRTERDTDAERGPCPGCGHPEHPPEHRFCGRCGTFLEHPKASGGELAPRTTASEATPRKRLSPVRLGPVGRTVAAGLVAVAADAGLAWLRHRLGETGRSVATRDVGSAPRTEHKGGSEQVYGYLLEETAFFIEEGRGRRWSYSSELAVRRGRIEQGSDGRSP